MPKPKPVSAKELMSRLEENATFVVARARRDADHEERTADLRRAEAPLVDELRRLGHDVESASDLMGAKRLDRKTISMLLDHLQRDYPGPIREGIARALAVKQVKELGWTTLVRICREDPEKCVRDGAAVAIAAAADDNVLDDVISLLRDERLGTTRVLLLSALERSKHRRALEELERLETQPDLHDEVQRSLKRLRGRKLSSLDDRLKVGSAPRYSSTALAEASMNFDLDAVAPFLAKVRALVDGWSEAEVQTVVRLADDLDVDEQGERQFLVRHAGAQTALVVRVVKDDEDAVNLFFFTSAALAREIESAMESFAEERGI